MREDEALARLETEKMEKQARDLKAEDDLKLQRIQNERARAEATAFDKEASVMKAIPSAASYITVRKKPSSLDFTFTA